MERDSLLDSGLWPDSGLGIDQALVHVSIRVSVTLYACDEDRRMAGPGSPADEETALSVALAAEITDALVAHGLVDSREDTST